MTRLLLALAALAALGFALHAASHGHWLALGAFGFCALVYGAVFCVAELRRLGPEADRR